MESKILSSTGFLHEFSIEELYVVTTHWLADITFFEVEILYFQSLISRYFIQQEDQDSGLLIHSLRTNFESLNNRKNQLQKQIQKHQVILSAYLGELPGNESEMNVAHSSIESQLFEFVRTLRQTKLEFFNATKFREEI